jgi:hypothetical protein
LNRPPFLLGEHSSSHWSGVLAIAIIVVETCKFVDVEDNQDIKERSKVRGQNEQGKT